MPREQVQAGFGYDGKGTVLWVPTIADTNAPTVAEPVSYTHLTLPTILLV